MLGAEEPSLIRGGARLGGRGGPLESFVGDVTKYVVEQGALPRDRHRAGRRATRRSSGAAPSASSRARPSSNLPRLHRLISRRMFVLIVGAGRVGSAVAKSALAAGHEVSVLDEDPLSHERLDAGQTQSWEDAGGQFTVGTALETDALIQAGIERADVFIASTAGDNTNLVIAQIAQQRFGVEKVIVRVMDPARAELVRRTGPAHDLPDQARDRDVRARARARAGASACTRSSSAPARSGATSRAS